MRWRDIVFVLYRFILLLFLIAGISKNLYSQSSCDPTTPSFTVNLVGSPGGIWTSNPPLARNGHCCNVTGSDRCVEFVITLDENAIGINFQIASGAVPPGALYYQIDCGPLVQVGSPICVDGPGPYRLTFCKPGSNINTYSITSIPKPAVSPTTTTSDGCNIKIGASGIVKSSITWTSVAPGFQGQYNSYLSCTTGCDTVKVSPLPGYPAYVDYRVCGTPLGGVCSTGSTFCDTVRVYFVPPIANSISPNPASYCVNNPGVMLNSVINGGVQPYTYIWKNSSGVPVGNNSTYWATSPGSYVLEVRDSTYPGCPSKLATVNVTIDPVPTVNAGPNVTVCPGNPNVQLNGAVTNATGGIWSGGSGTFSPNASTLNAVYTPSATEIAAGMAVLTLSSTGMGACAPVTDQMIINITQPLAINAVMPSLVCYGQTANITATVTGGTPPYQYSWSNGSTNQSIYNVLAGGYTVTVTDATANSCTRSRTFVLNQNPPLSLTVPSNSIITCDSSVYVSISASGGSGDFTYLWNTGETTSGITVNSGIYTITATDSVGCTVKDTVSIQAAGTAINVNVNEPSTLCYNGTTTLFATGSGGFGGYIYGWNTGQSTQSITVSAGNYCVTIEDTVGCLYTRCVTVSQAPQLQVTVPAPAPVCFGGSTTVTATASGGTPPYTYSWNTGETTEYITKTAGTYSVTVFDANSNACSATTTVTITQASDLNLSFNSTPVSCFAGNNGTATVSVTGGTPPYNYAWNPFGGNSTTAYLLNAGTYTVNVYDSKGCSKSGSVTVSQPPLLNASMSSVTDVSCAGNSNGSATVTATGGTPGYTYFWSPSGETNPTSNSLPAGSNSVVIQDSKGCIKTLNITIAEPTALVAAIASSTDVSCNGGNDGSASVLVSGGTSPYNYTWLETGDNTSSVSNLYTGNYNIAIQDAAGCATTATVTIQQPALLTSSISASSNVSCYGSANGSATVSVNGGSPGYSYSWSNSAGSSASVSGLTPNSYTVTVTDLEGCQTTSSVLITQPSKLTFSQASATPASCSGGCDGQVSVSVTGGNGSYQYLWLPGNYTTATVSNLCAGSYSVRVTDINGCFKDTTLIINEPQPLQITSSITGSNCSQPNGSATASVTGGTPGYNYSWSSTPVQTTSVASGLTPGNYTIRVTDTKGCITQSSVTIQNIPGVTTTISTSSNVTCNSACNGSALVSTSGGTGPYTYSWSTTPVQTSATATNLCAGTYIVKVTGADGCSDTSSVSITQPGVLNITQTAITPVNCYGDATGSATVEASGGAGSYNYLWNTTPVQSGPVATGLTSGNYIVTVTDANNCTDTLHIVIQQPASALQLGITNTNINCFGASSGTATATVSGGTPGYTYSWNTIPSQSTPAATNLTAGTYSVNVSDNKGCSLISSPVIITQPASTLSATIGQTNVDCFGNNSGSATATVSGGTPPYNYTWNTTPVQTGPTAMNLVAGSYSVSISDAYGCSINSSVIEITQPPAALSVSVTSSDVSCFGLTTGSATATVSGGTTPYTYNWSTNPTQTTPTISSLSAGTYTLNVTDNKGCSYTNNNVVITQPSAPLQMNVNNTNLTCYGANNATATATVSGGTPGYTYSWNTIPSQSTPIASSLSAGTYSVYVTDNHGCGITSTSVIVTQPAATLDASITQTNIDCYGNNSGSATATVTGGTAPYQYTWSTTPVQSGPTAMNLVAGSYSVTISDYNGCIINSPVIEITQPPAGLAVSVTSTSINCFGQATGSAQATVSGGTTPYTFNWSTIPQQNTPAVTSLAAGTYTLIVTDNKGCSYTNNNVVITQPSAALQMNINNTNLTCYGANNATATATVSGGTPGYTYSWNTIPSQSTPVASNLSAGTYSVIVTDNKGCSLTSGSVVVTQPSAALSSAISQTNVDCFGNNSGSATATVTGGTPPYQYTWSTIPVQTGPTAMNLVAGSYSVTISDNNGCMINSPVIEITQPPAGLAVSVTSTSINCFGQATGSAQATVSGGTTPYTFNWSTTPPQNTPAVTSLTAGTYTLVVTDNKGCSYTNNNVVITQPSAALQMNINNTNLTCFGGNNASATATVTGGTPGYTYSWNTIPSQSTPIATNLSAGTYSVIVTDNKGCSLTSGSVVVTQPSAALSSAISQTNVDCFGNNSGSATATITGGTPPYQYTWSTTPVQTGPIAMNLIAGSYSVSISDDNGCTINSPVIEITQPLEALSVSVTSTSINCFGAATGTAQANVTGGTTPYTYNWSTTPVQNTPGVSGLTAGTYTLVVNDMNGCSYTNNSIAITQPTSPISVNINHTNVNCFGANTASATASVSGGSPGYTYSWSTIPSQSTPVATNLAAGTYSVMITDNKGCSYTSGAVIITQPAAGLSATLAKTNIDCYGNNSGQIQTTVSGGTAPYTYSWSTTPNQTGPNAVGLYAGTYSVKVTDAVGCIFNSQVISITQPSSALQADVITENINCFGDATGAANASVTGGTTPYTYSWSTTPVQNTSSITSLTAGTYTLLVTDQNGCPFNNNEIVITQPLASLQVAISSTNINCFGTSTGTASASVSGGTPGYTFSWNTTPFQNTPTANNLTAGTYSVTVSDEKGCMFNSQPIVLTQPSAPLHVSILTQNVSCFGNNTGSIQATVTGGTTPYVYSWSTTPSQNGPVATGLPVGTYSFEVKDSKGCIAGKADIDINQPTAALSVSLSKNNVNCYGDSTGSVEAIAFGGTEPYTYSWNTIPVQNTPTATGLSAGTYSLLVTDNNGCTWSQNSIVISQPSAALQITATNTNVNCFGANTATATVNVNGGTPSYTYSWSTIPVQTTPVATGLTAGTYSVTVTDALNCIVNSGSILIKQPSAGLNVSVIKNNINCYGDNTGSILTTTTGGTSPYTYSWSTTPVQTGPNASNLGAGTYSLSVTDNKGCIVTMPSIVLTQPLAGLSANVGVNNVSCFGDSTGIATAVVTGGTQPYTYSWNTNPVQLTSIADSLAAGVYTLQITDQNGCTFTNNQITITQPAQQLTLTIVTDDVNCFGDNSGSATATVTGGTAPYTYNWNTIPVQTTSQASNLASGIYMLNITDSNGCMVQAQEVEITEPVAALSVTTSKNNVLCFGNNTGSATANATGGTAPYTYSWNTTPVQTTSTINNLETGLYSVSVTDSKGCSYSASPVQITEPSEALAATTSLNLDVSCYGGSDGSATVTVTGGTEPYSYSWNSSPIQNTSTASSLPAGNYFVKITDANGCTVTSNTSSVSQPNELKAVISSTTAPACASNNGSATVSVSGGSGPYFYSWNTSPSQTLATASNLYAGTYMVMVTDLKGCQDSATVVLSQPQTVTFITAGAFPTTCNESCDGYAVVIAGGGVAPYTYSWSTGGTGPAINNLCEGYYTIYVYDNKGCYADTVLHITSPVPITLTSEITPANCYQNNGAVTVTPSGGMASYSYSWSTTPVSFGPTLNGVVPGDYTVNVTDSRGCQSSMIVTVPNIPGVEFASTTVTNTLCKDSCDGTAMVTASSGSAPYTYFWNSTPPQFAMTAYNLCAGTYKATVRDNDGCWDTVSVTIDEPDYIIASSSAPDTICIGQSTTLTASAEGGNGEFTYNWNYGEGFGSTYNVSPVVTTNYALLVTDTNGCRSQVITVPVKVHAPITVTEALSDSICPGEVATVSATVTGGDGKYEYVWMPGSITTSSFEASPSETTNYTLIVKDGCGSPIATDSAKIVIFGLPQIAFTPDARAGCKPLCVNFTNNSTVSSGNITNWNWTFSNGEQSSQSNPMICFNEDGTTNLRVEATSNFGCKTAVTLQNYIEVYPDPVADFVVGPQPADILNPLIQFTDKSQGASEWSWSFNDRFEDKFSTEQNPTCMYSDTGSFCPVLKVTNQYGCINEKEDCLYIQPEYAFYIPNAFSPNGDGYNETFTGVGTMVVEYEMMIFDRWGNLIYQTDEIDKPWDGTANDGNISAQEDVYVYRIKVWDQNRQVHDYYGTVSLVK